MFRLLAFGFAILMATASSAFAVEKDLHHWIDRLTSRDNPTYVVSQIADLQVDGQDISAAREALKSYVRQNVSDTEETGVTKDGEEALLCLMRMGDKDAQDHFLIAQRRAIQRFVQGGKWWVNYPAQELYDFYVALDEPHRKVGYELLMQVYRILEPRLSGKNVSTSVVKLFFDKELLACLLRLAPDTSTQVKLLNRHYVELPYFINEFFSVGDARLVYDILFDLTQHPELFPKFETLDPKSYSSCEGDYKDLLCYMAPFRPEMWEKFSKWINDDRATSMAPIAAYVDSASRLPEEKRKEALAALESMGEKWFQKNQDSLEYDAKYLKPRYLKDGQKVLRFIRETFGDNYLPTEEAKKALDIDAGLGIGF